jgi:hypothetical protein
MEFYVRLGQLAMQFLGTLASATTSPEAGVSPLLHEWLGSP